MPDWVEFARSDADLVVAMVRAVADVGDAGEHGDGVEVVVEAPRPGWLAGLFGDHEPDQARVAVTKRGGEVRYPFHVQLITDHGGDAAHRVPHLPGWAASNSAGLAFLVWKAAPAPPGNGWFPRRDGFARTASGTVDWAGLVGGAVAALSALRPDAGDPHWRAAVDRGVRRATANRGALRG